MNLQKQHINSLFSTFHHLILLHPIKSQLPGICCNKERKKEMEKSGAERRHGVVLVPYPFQGHITPMLQLASILHTKGFSIFVAHTQFNSPNPSNHPEFTFLPLSDDSTSSDTYFYNTLDAVSIMNKICKAPFEKYMSEMQDNVACIIYDSIMRFVDVVANHLNLPSIVLRTNTAAYMHSHFAVFQLLEQNLIPLPGIFIYTYLINPVVYKLAKLVSMQLFIFLVSIVKKQMENGISTKFSGALQPNVANYKQRS